MPSVPDQQIANCRLLNLGETKTAMDVFFFIFGILTVALNGLLIIGTTKKQK